MKKGRGRNVLVSAVLSDHFLFPALRTADTTATPIRSDSRLPAEKGFVFPNRDGST